MKKSWVVGDNNVVLFQNKNWSIEKTKEKEICVSNGYNTSFGYYDSIDDNCKWDWIFFPNYIKKIAIKLARKHIKPLISEIEMAKDECEICHQSDSHNRMCPNNIINSDGFQYRTCQY